MARNRAIMPKGQQGAAGRGGRSTYTFGNPVPALGGLANARIETVARIKLAVMGQHVIGRSIQVPEIMFRRYCAPRRSSSGSMRCSSAMQSYPLRTT